MRLNQNQIQLICETVHQHIGGRVRTWLFGSRTDDKRRGGDIDLLIESDSVPAILQQARIKTELEQSLSIPVDLVCRCRGCDPTSFQRIAMSTAIPLEPLQ